LSGELARVQSAAASSRESLERLLAERAAVGDALRAAVRASVPPTIVEHIEATVAGAPVVTDVAVRPVAALYVTLRAFDAWAAKAPAAEVKKRLDHYCNSVALRARANGGRVEQVLGHMHLLLFPSDAASVRAAIRCGLEIASLVPEEQGVGVASALHVSTSAAGFFGEGDTATRVEVGEAVMVSRGVASLAHESSFFVTDAVQKLVGTDPAFTLAMAGPAALVGGPTVQLYKVIVPDGGSA
jgi:class 3 adenylate cyclase